MRTQGGRHTCKTSSTAAAAGSGTGSTRSLFSGSGGGAEPTAGRLLLFLLFLVFFLPLPAMIPGQ